MVKNLSILLRYFLFWLIFFFLERLIFILAFYHRVSSVSLSEIGKSFIVGLWMDTSMAAYICALPLLITLILWFIPAVKFPSGILKWYTGVIVGICAILCTFNFNLYREWGSKVNYKALEIAFTSPEEAVASSASSPILISLLTLLALIASSLWIANRLIRYKRLQNRNLFLRLLTAVMLIGLNVLAIRGGWQLSPMNESMAYFSDKPLLNHAAINTEWALLRDILNNKSNDNPYQYYDTDEARRIVAELMEKPSDHSNIVLSNKRPNVVLVILESFTADVVESLGGERGVAPQLETLASDGLLFENIYASGDRTDKGVVAILNAFPSQAIRSIMKLNSKQEKLPSLAQNFRESGYSTKFFYGGESEFFNMKSYLLSHSYQQITDKASFDKKDMNSKWGAFDEVVYSKLASDARHAKEPFFYTLLTLTNHEPFELPGRPRFPGEGTENKFRSTAFYADSCLGAFINQAKKEPWYANTLFVIVADHGHRLPKNQYEIYHPNRFRIPLLFFGEVIKPEFRGKNISKTGSQTDLAATLFSQLKIRTDNFAWSRDLLNPNARDFAFFDWDNGFGVATKEEVVSFDNVGKNVVYSKPEHAAKNDTLLRYGKAYMQQVYQQYLEY